MPLIALALTHVGIVHAEPLPGPVSAEVLEVIDADTIAVRAHIWPGHFVETRVRLSGIDAPERRGADCETERERAEIATAFTRAWLDTSPRVELHDVETGSFAGRVIAQITRSDGETLSDALIAADLAVAYGAPSPWCGGETAPSLR